MLSEYKIGGRSIKIRAIFIIVRELKTIDRITEQKNWGKVTINKRNWTNKKVTVIRKSTAEDRYRNVKINELIPGFRVFKIG